MLEPLADGTVRTWNPFSDEVVLCVPERRHRPQTMKSPAAMAKLAAIDHDSVCDFCAARYDMVTPEKSRLVRDDDGNDVVIDNPSIAEVFGRRAAFRRFCNLFEIVGFQYWRKNHAQTVAPEIVERHRAYLADRRGEQHLRTILAHKLGLCGEAVAPQDIPRAQLEELTLAFFAGSHDLVVGDRHYVDNASTIADVVSSGALSQDDHHAYVAFSLRSARAIQRDNPHVRSVAVFQNWLRSAGASFEHLHKQLLGIDSWGPLLERKIEILRTEPRALYTYGVELAREEKLVIAENDRAVAWVDPGHRFTTLTVMSLGDPAPAGAIDAADLRALSDLLHACHAGLGSGVALNEEWQIQPLDCDVDMPLHVHLRLREHSTAGFEGATGMFVSPHRPQDVRDRLISGIRQAIDEKNLAGVSVGNSGT